jgi:maleylpyruvate isomerase
VKLYNYWRSSSSWRVRIALSYKGISYEYVPVNIAPRGDEQLTADFAAVNPMHQVPVLEMEEGGAVRRIAQSMAILEYLEERFPAPALLPSGATARARVRQLAEMVNSGIQPLQNLYVQRFIKHTYGGDGPAFARHFVTRGLAALEQMAGETAGRFLFGDAPSFADVYLVPQLYAARRVDIDLAPMPRLLAVETQCQSLPAFAAAHPDKQPDVRPDPPKKA